MSKSVIVKFKKMRIFQNLNKAEQLAVRAERRGAASRVVDTGGCVGMGTVRIVVVLLRRVCLQWPPTNLCSELIFNVRVQVWRNDLTWNAHVNNLVKKLKFRLFTLRRLSHCIPRALLKSVACGIFLSVIRYGLPLYNFLVIRIRAICGFYVVFWGA